MLGPKVLTAIVAVPILIVLMYLGGWPFFVAVTVTMLVGLQEFYTSVRREDIVACEVGGWVCALGLCCATQFVNWDAAFRSGIITACIAGAVLMALIAQFWRPTGTSVVANAGATVLGVVWVALLFSFMLRLRMLSLSAIAPVPEGGFRDRTGILFLVILIVWLQDNAAQLSGMAFGTRKPWPHISPNKTWEGCIGGFTAAVLAATVVGTAFGLPVLEMVGLGAVLGVFGQLGDFCKSLIKRELGIKDFGRIIPGHGGVLDRFDSLLFTMPIAYVYFRLFLVLHGASLG